MADRQPLKVLSLDGGGVRGIATLYLLRRLMLQIALFTGQRPEPLRPCDYFDLIAGTSTGGLIAIMLGRLRYTVDQAIEKYISLSKDIFSAPSSDADAKFDYRTLERRIKEVISEAPCPRPNTLTANDVLEDDTVEIPHDQRVSNGQPVAGCRIFVVCTLPRGSGARPKILRSYKTLYDFPFSGKIWEAARATSAAPTFFAPITIDRVTYGDGGTGWNNPTRLVIDEVRQKWPNRPIGCLISLGTGEEDPNQLATAETLPRQGLRQKLFSSSMPKSSFKLEVAKYCAKCLTNCKRVHEDVLSNLERDHLVNSYFRLNTPGVGKIALEEWNQIGDMIDLTVDYLDAPEIKRMTFTIASRMTSYHSQSADTNILVQPELDISEGSQQLPIRHLIDDEPQELSDDYSPQASASAVSNTRSDLYLRPVAYLLAFAADCTLLAQDFDAIKHIAPSLHRLNTRVMGLTRSLRQLCHNMLNQVPSSILFKDLIQIEGLPDPDTRIPLLPLLQKDLQTRIDFFDIVSELQKGLKNMKTELDKLKDHILEQGIERDPRRIQALVESCDFDEIHDKVKISESCFKQLPAKLQKHLCEEDKISQPISVQDPTTRNTPDKDPLLIGSIVARFRLVRELSSEVYQALAKACSDHASHSAQFQLGPYHTMDCGPGSVMDFQIRFSSDMIFLPPHDARLHSVWLLIRSPCKEDRCSSKRRIHNALERTQFGIKRKLPEAFDQNVITELSANKQVKRQTERDMTELGPDHKFSVKGRDIDSSTASVNSVKGIDFSAQHNFCSRMMSFDQGKCLHSSYYLGFFRVETDTEHKVFFSDAYQRLSQCQCTSLYDVFATEVSLTNRKSFQHERVELAKQLASAMLQFQNSPLLQHLWGGDDIVFFTQPKSVKNFRSMLTAPYLDVKIKSSSQSPLIGIDEDNTFESERSVSFIKNLYLFQLATLFIEIAYQAKIENLMSSEEVDLCEDDRDLWCVANRLCDDISGNLGSQYRAIVRRCLEWSRYDEHLVSPDKYENMICKEVVNELEVLKFAMVNKLHS